MAEYLKSEIKSGVMIVISILILLILLFFVGGLNFFKKEFHYKVYFNSIAQLEEGAPVTFAGHKMGHIDSITITPEKGKQVEIVINFPANVKVKEDSVAEIIATGVIGLKCLAITPGSKNSPTLPPGATIQAKEPLDIQEIINTAGGLGDNIAATILSIKATSDRFRLLAEKFDAAEFSLLLKNVNEIMEENKGDVREIIKNLKDTAVNAKEFSAIIKNNPSRLIWKTRERKKKETELEKLRRLP